MGTILRSADTKWVSFPISDDVFKVAGGGQNYVHGGSSPQEMLVPVLDSRWNAATWRLEMRVLPL